MDVELGIANGINIAELKETIEEHPDAKQFCNKPNILWC